MNESEKPSGATKPDLVIDMASVSGTAMASGIWANSISSAKFLNEDEVKKMILDAAWKNKTKFGDYR